MGTPKNQPVRIKTVHVGVYYRVSVGKEKNCPNGQRDRCYDITYRNSAGKFVFERVGWRSEGYTLQDAVELRNLRIREVRHPELFKAQNEEKLAIKKINGITVHKAWIEFQKYWLPNLRGRYEAEKVYERHIRPQFGHRYITSISELEIEEFKNNLLQHGGHRGQPLNPASVQWILRNFSRIINKALRWNLMEGKNPLTGVSIKNCFDKRERYLTREEADKILDGLQFVSCSLYHISKIALNTGLRLSEILNLRGSDINLDRGCIRVRLGKTGDRDAYIPQKFSHELAMIIPANKSAFLFSDANGQPLSAGKVSFQFASFIRQTGLNPPDVPSTDKIVFHTFRHTFCSWLAIAGVPIYTIAKLAGHKNINMTQRYAKLSPGTQRAALDATFS